MQNVDFEMDDVNYVLHECGIDGINSLEDDSNLDLVNALACLRDAQRAILAKGFSFNTYDTELSPDMDGFIRWPSGVFTLQATDGTRVVNQQGYLMKPIEGFSTTFTSKLPVQVIMKTPLVSCPEPVRAYILNTAAEFMNDRWITSDVIAALIAKHKEEAWVNFREWWTNDDDVSIFDNQAVQQLSARS